MRITRREVLYAIRNEKLTPGSYLDYEGAGDSDKIKASSARKECTVCAVGAVMRRAVLKRQPDISVGALEHHILSSTERSVESVPGEAERVAEDKQYLDALSMKYEALAAKYGSGKRTRAKLIAFVKKYFPKQFNVKTV